MLCGDDADVVTSLHGVPVLFPGDPPDGDTEPGRADSC